MTTSLRSAVPPPSLAEEAGFETVVGEGSTALSTRFGVFHGRLERVSVKFDAVEGDPLTIDATCFVSAEWPGPMVIGWRGCLERMRFGFDTTTEVFYFAPG